MLYATGFTPVVYRLLHYYSLNLKNAPQLKADATA
jgi:hypothetical protein